jgi:hypothetical protein
VGNASSGCPQRLLPLFSILCEENTESRQLPLYLFFPDLVSFFSL